MNRVLFWTPRVVGILFTAFVSLFAFDVFAEGYGFWEAILALLIHLVPTGLLLITLAIAWRYERLGGMLFIALGIFYVVAFWGRVEWPGYLLIAGPAILTGLLFWLAGWYRARAINEARGFKR